MPLPEDEATWDKLDVMFATTRGKVRRNKLSDFADVRRSGIIAMKLDEGDAIVDVQICTERDDVLLTPAGGQCIRFPVNDVRVFQGRTSMGVRGIALADGDKLISLSILRHVEATRRRARRPISSAPTRCGDGGAGEAEENGDERRGGRRRDRARRRSAMSTCRTPEQFVLTDLRKGLRQAHLVLRIPHHRPRRQRHRRHVGHREERPAGGLVPGRGKPTRSCWSPTAAS